MAFGIPGVSLKQAKESGKMVKDMLDRLDSLEKADEKIIDDLKKLNADVQDKKPEESNTKIIEELVVRVSNIEAFLQSLERVEAEEEPAKEEDKNKKEVKENE